MKRKGILWIAAICVLCLGAGLVSCMNFGTGNFVRVISAYTVIASGEADYVELAEEPRIVLATPDDSLEVLKTALEEEGYTILEEKQMGSLLRVSRDGREEQIQFRVNGFYSLWQWQ